MSSGEMFRYKTRISPLLQSMLLQGLEKVKESMDNSDWLMAWQRLKSLHIISPPQIRKEVQSEIDSLIGQINVTIQSQDDLDRFTRVTGQTVKLSRLLRENVPKIFLSITDKLYAGGYMESVAEYRKGHELEY